MREPGLVGSAIRQKWLPEFQGAYVALVERHRRQRHRRVSQRGERLPPGWRRLGQHTRRGMSLASCERRRNGTRELISGNSLRGRERDEVYQVFDTRILLCSGQRVRVELLRKVLGHRIHGEFNRSDTGKPKEVRSADLVRFAYHDVTAGEVDVKRRKLLSSHARSDSYTQGATRSTLQLFHNLPEVEGEVVRELHARDHPAKAVERSRQRQSRAEVDVSCRAGL